MRLSLIVERRSAADNFFKYDNIVGEVWRKLIHAAQDAAKIDFDLENDSPVTRRKIVVPQDEWEHTECKFHCELFSAGGDWQLPVGYFRCQLVSGYADGLGYDDKHFVFIPTFEQGNTNLVRGGGEAGGDEGGWVASDESRKKDEARFQERKLWAALREHLAGMVQRSVDGVREQRDVRPLESYEDPD